MAQNTLPSFLNYTRSISPSEGILAGLTAGGDVIPVQVVEKGIRGSISSYSNVYKPNGASDSDKNIAKRLDPENPNLQRIDVAFLPVEADRLRTSFSVVFQANALAPAGCNDSEMQRRLREIAQKYAVLGGFHHLAERYTWNLVNCRALWRNRYAAEKKVTITVGGKSDAATKESWTFDGDNIPSSTFPGADEMPEGFAEVAALVGDALAGRTPPLFLDVEVVGLMPPGTEVYPSQEFMGNGGGRGTGKDKVNRVLSSTPTIFRGEPIRQATLHTQKIGNAIRTIDEWHGQVDEFGATPVEAYGYLQSRSIALRLPNSPTGAPDIYKVLIGLDEVDQALDGAGSAADLPGTVHYLIAVLIRGGVFSGSKKD